MSKEVSAITEQQPLSRTQEIAIRTGINQLAEQVHQASVNHGWWDADAPGQTVGEKLMLIVSEVAEALESDRNHEPPLWFKHIGFMLGKPEGIAAELADAIIRILDLCEHRGWPVTEALVLKHNYNLTREHRHGGKAY